MASIALIIFSLCVVPSVVADVYVTDSSMESTVAEYRSMAANFGRPFPDDGIRGRAVKAKPVHGCSKLAPPPDVPADIDPTATTWIAVIQRRGSCTFEEKVRNAMLANYSGAIVYNFDSNTLIPMAGDDDALIPSLFLGYDDAQVLLSKYTFKKSREWRVVLSDDHPFDINSYLLPFAIVVGICFLVMLVIVVYKCAQDYRRHRRHRLPKSALKRLPMHKYADGDPFDTCCICLDDFLEGDKMRILPCDHGYHAKCIDPWLVKTKRICPQCRKRVFETNELGAGLVSGGTDSEQEEEEYREREPLLGNRRFTHRQRRIFRRQHQADGGETSSRGAEGRLERIRRAFGRRGPQALLQQRGILSSEDNVSSSSDDESSPTGEVAIGVEQTASPNVLVADIHAVHGSINAEPQPGPSRPFEHVFLERSVVIVSSSREGERQTTPAIPESGSPPDGVAENV